ncbi:hypothetical protein ACUH95_00555 [Dermabacteraceae bacterium P13101]
MSDVENPHVEDEQEFSESEAYSYLSAQEQELLVQLTEITAEHEARITALEDSVDEDKIPRDWISRHQNPADWEELAVWVDWLNDNYSMPDEMRVPACWPAHPGLVHVLAGLRSSWRNSVLADMASKERQNAMAAFHDYHLFPFFARMQQKQMFRCNANGHKEDVRHAPTDRAYFPEYLFAQLDEPEPEEETPVTQ